MRSRQEVTKSVGRLVSGSTPEELANLHVTNPHPCKITVCCVVHVTL